MPDISISGNKMVKTIQSEFTKKFPFLQLCIFPYSEKSKSSKSQFPGDTRIADVRKKGTTGDMSIGGNKLVKTLENEFVSIYGLYAEVCYYNKEGKGFYTGATYDAMTLSTLNKEGEKNGWQKGKTR